MHSNQYVVDLLTVFHLRDGTLCNQIDIRLFSVECQCASVALWDRRIEIKILQRTFSTINWAKQLTGPVGNNHIL